MSERESEQLTSERCIYIYSIYIAMYTNIRGYVCIYVHVYMCVCMYMYISLPPYGGTDTDRAEVRRDARKVPGGMERDEGAMRGGGK